MEVKKPMAVAYSLMTVYSIPGLEKKLFKTGRTATAGILDIMFQAEFTI